MTSFKPIIAFILHILFKIVTICSAPLLKTYFMQKSLENPIQTFSLTTTVSVVFLDWNIKLNSNYKKKPFETGEEPTGCPEENE